MTFICCTLRLFVNYPRVLEINKYWTHELFKYISTNKSDILKTEDNFRDTIENNIVMHTITTRNINSVGYIVIKHKEMMSQ